MARPIRILLQTTIPYAENDWHVGRFSLLKEHLASLTDDDGAPLVEVTARNREVRAGEPDPVLASFGLDDFDELWLFAVDTGDGLTEDECENVTRFHRAGGGVLATRDHQDLGSSLCTLGRVGKAHHFHSKQLEPDADRHADDDRETTEIHWPNYHSGRNGDYHPIEPVEPVHDLLRSGSGVVERFPSHPHEGAVGVPEDEPSARVVATARSVATGRPFNLVVAFERDGEVRGRAVAESSFHHFADYNWDPAKGCPTFVTESPGDGYARDPAALDDVKTYVRNAALWLAPE